MGVCFFLLIQHIKKLDSTCLSLKNEVNIKQINKPRNRAWLSMIKISLSGNISTPDYLSRTLIKVSCDFLGWRSNRDCSTPLVIIKSIWSMQSYLSKQETLSASVSSCTSKTLIFSFVAMLIRECIINGLFSSAQDASRCKRRMGGSCGAALVPGSPACSQIRKRNSRPLSTLMPT